MSRHPSLEFEQQVAQRFLSEPAESLIFEPIQSGFSGAGVVRVKTATAAYALRRWPKKSFPPQRILELHRFLAHLESYALPVAVPLSDQGSNSTLVFANETYWQLEPWLPGEPIAGESLEDSQRRSMMHTLAQIHLAAEKYIPTKAGTEWFSCANGHVPAILERVQLIKEWTPQRLRNCQQSLHLAPQNFRILSQSIIGHFQKHAERISYELQHLSHHRCRHFPCWRDLWRDHILFLDNKVSGVIDASATRCDHVGTDLSRLLGSLFGDDQQQWKLALNDYQQLRELSAVDLELIHALDRSSVLLSGMTWVDRWHKQMLDQTKFPTIVERLKVIEMRMRSL